MYGVRDRKGLASISASVDQSVFGIDIYPTVFSKATFLWRSLTNYHCFYNGNKRTAFVTAYLFLLMNDFQLLIDTRVFYEAALAIAAGEMADEQIEELLLAQATKCKSEVRDDLEFSNVLETVYEQDAHLKKLIEELSLT